MDQSIDDTLASLDIHQRITEYADKNRYVIWAVLFVWGLLFFNGQWLVGADSALYAKIAQNANEGLGYIHPADTQSKNSQEIGLIYIIQIHDAIFGYQIKWPLLVFILAVGYGSWVLIYQLFLFHCNRGTSLCLTVLCALTENVLKWQYEILRETIYLFVFLLMLIGLEMLLRSFKQRSEQSIRYKLSAFLMFFGSFPLLHLLRDITPVILIAILATGILSLRGNTYLKQNMSLKRINQIRILLFILFTFGVLFGLGNYRPDRIVTIPENFLYLFNEAFAEACLGSDLGPYFSSVFTVVFLTMLLFALFIKRRVFWCMLLLFMIIGQVFITVVDRYMMVLMPFAIYGFWTLTVWLSSKFHGRKSVCVCLLMIALWVLPNLVENVGFLIEQRTMPFYQSYKKGRYEVCNNMAHVINRTLPENAAVIMSRIDPLGRHRNEAQRRYLSYLTNRKVRPINANRDIDFDTQPVYFLWHDQDEKAQYFLSGRELSQLAPIHIFVDTQGRRWALSKLIQNNSNVEASATE